MTTLGRRKERLPFTGDQRMKDKPEFIHQPGIAALNARPRKTLGWRTPAEAFDAAIKLVAR